MKRCPWSPTLPTWGPAFAGVVRRFEAGMMLRSSDSARNHPLRADGISFNKQPFYHPGEGRGPVGKADLTERCTSSPTSPTWAPAFAGVVESGGANR